MESVAELRSLDKPSSEALRAMVAKVCAHAVTDGSKQARAVVEACDEYIVELNRFEGRS